MQFKINWQKEIRQTAADIIASIGWAIGISLFAAPNGIAPSGFNGIAVLLNYLFGLPIGTMSLLFNVPILLLACRILGKSFAVRTLRTIACYSIITDVFFGTSFYTYHGDALMAAIFGGLFNGAATALIFMQGSTGGGTDVVNRMLQKKYPYFSVGQLSLAMNAVVMCSAAVVYQNINAALYGLVFSFVTSKILDSILNGLDMGKCVLIVTHHPDEISRRIIDELHRSATILSGTGAYLRDETSVLLCVVRKQQFYHLKKFVAACDPKAFLIITDATQIIGTGFKPISAE